MAYVFDEVRTYVKETENIPAVRSSRAVTGTAGSARSIVRSAGQDRQDAEVEGDHSEHEADAATKTVLSF